MPSCRHDWRLHWVGDGAVASFEVEQEGCGLTDDSMQDWGDWMDAQFERRFGAEDWPPLVASSLNFSKNSLGDEAVHLIVDYLRHRGISPVLLKFFENQISDRGAISIGRLLATAREPVHEVHLSHNRITEIGAKSILEAIAESGRYPFDMKAEGQRDRKMPLWMRLEFNSICRFTLQSDLDRQVTWCLGDSRSEWHWTPPSSRSGPPMVCMHSSFASTQAGGPSAQEAGAALASDEVPLWVFLDASALRRFAAAPAPDADAEDSLFTFRSLLNLCRQGHMACVPEDDRPLPSWLGDVEEKDRVIFLVTDATLDELARADACPGQQGEFCEWLCNASDSYVRVCQQWGILEVIETKLHKELVKLVAWQRRAVELKLTRWSLTAYDFALLWASQVGTEDRVVFVTAEQAICSFAEEFAANADNSGCGVTSVQIDQLDRIFKLDHTHGGRLLHAAAQQVDATEFCGVVLSAQMMQTLVVERPLAEPSHAARPAVTSALSDASLRLPDTDAAAACNEVGDAEREASLRPPATDVGVEHDEVEVLRKQLAEASALLADARELLEAGTPPIVAASCVEKIKAAQLRFQAQLNQPL